MLKNSLKADEKGYLKSKNDASGVRMLAQMGLEQRLKLLNQQVKDLEAQLQQVLETDAA